LEVAWADAWTGETEQDVVVHKAEEEIEAVACWEEKLQVVDLDERKEAVAFVAEVAAENADSRRTAVAKKSDLALASPVEDQPV
jgi:ethanolamine utilization protein EutA (predicted chaperonin)